MMLTRFSQRMPALFSSPSELTQVRLSDELVNDQHLQRRPVPAVEREGASAHCRMCAMRPVPICGGTSQIAHDSANPPLFSKATAPQIRHNALVLVEGSFLGFGFTP